ncbi:MAG: phosphatidic acid phosphatase [Ruminococcaceae bacterium]|nr:phosphatidic acid phosphatase [Oscillospiraceae bacterium]
MKKPVVDYRQFRLSKVNDPQFSHLKLLLGWVGYFLMYLLTENLIPREACYPVHCALDDLIPFCEVFVIPYVFWYFMVAGSLLYFALYNTQSFRELMTYIIVTQVVAMAVYIIFPNRQDLRPDEFLRDNVLTRIVGFLYSFDTSTNVCPSLHVGYSLGLASAWLKEKGVAVGWKIFMVVAVILVCLSVAFIKQHSMVDVFAALPMCLLAELIAYRKRWLRRKTAAK